MPDTVDTPDATPTPDAATPAVPAETPPPAEPATPTPTPTPTPPPTEQTGADAGESSEVAKLRREAASWRTKLREQEQASEAAKAAAAERDAEAATLKDMLAKLNSVLNPDADTPPDPAKLAEQLAETRSASEKLAAEKDAKIRELTIKASLPGALTKNNADAALTEAVLIASGALAKLDPTSDTFAADLELAVQAAVEANPRLKNATAPAVKRSGADIPGRSGGDDQLSLEQYRELARKDPDAAVKAQKDGRLRNLGVR